MGIQQSSVYKSQGVFVCKNKAWDGPEARKENTLQEVHFSYSTCQRHLQLEISISPRAMSSGTLRSEVPKVNQRNTANPAVKSWVCLFAVIGLPVEYIFHLSFFQELRCGNYFHMEKILLNQWHEGMRANMRTAITFDLCSAWSVELPGCCKHHILGLDVRSFHWNKTLKLC